MNPQSPPKGSLEELFRHHLLESEAAAVPPRPLVWDQLDNSLLLAQNEKYRRRLLVHRWGMAASLLLAALAGGGWWHSQHPTSASLASASTHPQRQAEVARATGLGQQGRAAKQQTAAPDGQVVAYVPGTISPSVANQPLSAPMASAAAAQRAELAAQLTAGVLPTNSHSLPSVAAHARRTAASTTAGSLAAMSATGLSLPSTAQPIGSTSTSFSSVLSTAHSGRRQVVTGGAAGSPTATLTSLASTAQRTATTTSRMGETSLDGRLVALAPSPTLGLPASLPTVDVPPLPLTKLQHWRVGVQYTASAFQPNIDFGGVTATAVSANIAYSSNFSPSTTQAAAAEYRSNLRPGLGQRLGIRATRWLGGHWSLSTGVEAAQQEAYSATSVDFVGEPITLAISNSAKHELRRSTYRYRSAGIPVELRYENPVKNGVSFYGRLGAIVSALLNVHSEVAGSPEVTRTYSPFSTSTPYRRLTTLLRGGAGVRYRPASRTWGLNVGPTVEMGTQSLNADTDKSFLQQKRPYSFGVEAGLEFGGSLVPMQ